MKKPTKRKKVTNIFGGLKNLSYICNIKKKHCGVAADGSSLGS